MTISLGPSRRLASLSSTAAATPAASSTALIPFRDGDTLETGDDIGRQPLPRHRRQPPPPSAHANRGSIPELLERAQAAIGSREPAGIGRRALDGVDLVQLLQLGDDAVFLDELATERSMLHAWADQVERDLGAQARHIDPRIHAKLTASVKELRASVDHVRGSVGARVALVGAFVLLAAYPVALTMLSEPKELRSFVLLLGSTVKSAAVVAGEIRRPTTGRRTIADIARNRLFANIEQALLLTPHVARTSAGRQLADSSAYNIGVIFLSFTLLLVAFWGPTLADALAQSVQRMVGGTPEAASDPATRDMLHGHRDTARAFHAQITDFTAAFRQAGGTITRGANARKGDVLSAIDHLQHWLRKAAGDPPVKLVNRDLVPKAIASGAALAINTAAIMTFLGEPIAVADMSADDVFTAIMLASVTADPSRDAQDVAKSFQDWVALSAWLIPTMGVNAALHDPVATSKAAFAAYAVVVPVGNLIFPAWIGKGLSEAIGWAFRKFRQGDGEGGVAAVREAGAFARRMWDAGQRDGATPGERATDDQRIELDAMQRRIGLAPEAPGVMDMGGTSILEIEPPPGESSVSPGQARRAGA